MYNLIRRGCQMSMPATSLVTDCVQHTVIIEGHMLGDDSRQLTLLYNVALHF